MSDSFLSDFNRDSFTSKGAFGQTLVKDQGGSSSKSIFSSESLFNRLSNTKRTKYANHRIAAIPAHVISEKPEKPDKQYGQRTTAAKKSQLNDQNMRSVIKGMSKHFSDLRSANRMSRMVTQGQAYLCQYRGPGFFRLFDGKTGELSCTPNVPWQKEFMRPAKVSSGVSTLIFFYTFES